jgi:hypothetical protein
MESPENGGACFPPFPQTLEIERADFHIPSAPERDDEYNSSFKTRKDKNPASPTLRFLQAHPSIGKDYPAPVLHCLPYCPTTIVPTVVRLAAASESPR